MSWCPSKFNCAFKSLIREEKNGEIFSCHHTKKCRPAKSRDQVSNVFTRFFSSSLTSNKNKLVRFFCGKFFSESNACVQGMITLLANITISLNKKNCHGQTL
jgi:hypothetical protein